MSERRGFVLPAVIAAMVLMAMIVAIGAQRAMVSARQGSLDLARADMAVAASIAQVAALEVQTDSGALSAARPGTLLASGASTAATASARWSLVAELYPFATVEIDAQALSNLGRATVRTRALLVSQPDSAGGRRWVVSGSGGWTRIPSP